MAAEGQPDWRQLSGLAGLDERALRASCVRRRFKRNDIVFHEGDPAGALHLLDRGHMAVKRITPLFDEGIVDILQPGDTFGEQGLVDGTGVRTATVVALDGAETLALDRDGFEDLRQRHHGVDRFLLMVVAARLRRTTSLLVDALYLPADKRVLRSVLRLHGLFGAAMPSLTLTQSELAAMAGVDRSTANRILQRFCEAGTLAVSRGHVVVQDVSALEKACKV